MLVCVRLRAVYCVLCGMYVWLVVVEGLFGAWLCVWFVGVYECGCGFVVCVVVVVALAVSVVVAVVVVVTFAEMMVRWSCEVQWFSYWVIVVGR